MIVSVIYCIDIHLKKLTVWKNNIEDLFLRQQTQFCKQKNLFRIEFVV